MSPTRIAMIGAGMIGRTHLQVLLGDPAYKVAAIADPTPEAASLALQNDIPYFSNFEKMLDTARPDGAIAAVPNQLHVAAALACIARKVPVLIEKPITATLAEALELMAAADRAGVATLTGHHRRHHPILRAAAEAIGAGAIGRLTAVNAMWLSHKPKEYFDVAWRREPGAGTVLINGIHEIDCLRFLAGEIESLQAFAGNAVRGLAVEDTAAVAIRFVNGALGTLVLSDTVSSPWTWEWGSYENEKWPHESENCYYLAGTRGALAVPTLQNWWHEAGQSWTDPLTRRRIPYRPADCYAKQMRNFARVIRGEAKPVVSGWDGTRTLAATLAITESARTGAPVRIDDMLARGAAPAPRTAGGKSP
jgi:predicted dehydrogenase